MKLNYKVFFLFICIFILLNLYKMLNPGYEFVLSDYKPALNGIVNENNVGSLGSRIITINDSSVFSFPYTYINDCIKEQPDSKENTSKSFFRLYRADPNKSLESFIKKGDSISKKTNSNTVYVYRDGKVYSFTHRVE